MSALSKGLLAAGLVWAGLGIWLYLEKAGRFALVYKGCTTAGPALIALAGAVLRGTAADWVLAASALLFVAADVALEIRMSCGVLLFLAGHLGVIALALQRGAPFGAMLAAGAFGAVYMYLRHRRNRKKLGALVPVLSVYSFVLFAMLGACLAGLWSAGGVLHCGPAALLTAAGAVCFTASDLLLGEDLVSGSRTRARRWWIMVLYEAAVLLLVLAPFACWEK